MLKNLIAVVSLILLAPSAWAVLESQVESRFLTELVPYMQNNFTRGQFSGAGDVKINYYFKQVPNPKGVLIFAPGQTEASLKYAEVLYDLKDLEYSMYIIDHRGQGLSGRTLPGTTFSHVRKFQHYVDDFAKFVNEVVQPARYRHSMIIAHSMGGAIASGFLYQNPNSVRAAVLSGPMLEINTGKWGPFGASILSQLLAAIGKSTELAPGQTAFQVNSPFQGNQVTSSRPRYQMKTNLYAAMPELRIGGATVNWVKEALAFTTSLRQQDNVYSVPTLIFQGGHDQLVTSYGQNQTCAHSRAVCSIVKFPTAEHEILMEQDSIRNSALATIRAFIQKTENQ